LGHQLAETRLKGVGQLVEEVDFVGDSGFLLLMLQFLLLQWLFLWLSLFLLLCGLWFLLAIISLGHFQHFFPQLHGPAFLGRMQFGSQWGYAITRLRFGQFHGQLAGKARLGRGGDGGLGGHVLINVHFQFADA